MTRRCGVALEALAQLQDEIVDRARGGEDVISPHPLEQILARDDLTRAFGEHLENHGFFFAQLLSCAIPRARAKRAEIHFIAPKTQRRAVRRSRYAVIPLASPQNGAHAQQEFLQVEWLRKIVIASSFEPVNAILRIAARGQKQNGGVV